MTRPFARMLLAGAVLATAAACANAAMDDAPREPYPPERPNETQPGAKPPVPRRNPRAVPMDLVFSIESAPGPFQRVRAATSYHVENELCLPRLGGMSGTRVTARQFMEIDLQRTGPFTWRGRFHDHLFLDEDHFGLGVCRWRLAGVSIEFSATGSDGETRFSEFLFPDDIVVGSRVRAYFPRRHYPRGTMDDFPALGERDIGKFRPEVRDKLFSLLVEVRPPTP
ncbi:MAG: hypothetical protein ACOY37_10495 [Pseudomonadota bacterium]